ncbi:hypothetical protein E3N88_15234 [Mikania micrantha]|uniref:Uncharacterized protein n=1 Tax=Mikania micrantha TaxID=192012 RepID=A0A5N6NV24_9ASTR|nr:hypothetical protein E3N88_15234 [Mikania micrantha]
MRTLGNSDLGSNSGKVVQMVKLIHKGPANGSVRLSITADGAATWPGWHGMRTWRPAAFPGYPCSGVSTMAPVAGE